MIKRIARGIQHKMQEHYLSFRFLVWMNQCGITNRMRFWGKYVEDKKLRNTPSQKMLKSRQFFKRNRNRIDNLMSILEDEKSRVVWGGAIDYRTKRLPIRKGLYSEYDQYFVKDIIQLEENEVFVDCGAFIGDTIQIFMNIAKRNKVSYKIVAFEPDDRNERILNKFFGKRNDIVIIKKGLSNEAKVLLFDQKGTDCSRFTDNESMTAARIQAVNIDAVPECQNASWIKMDIEGAELDALRGAEEIIKRNHPKLTICIYHSDEDMIRIAEYIHGLVPEYKLFVRHHTRYGTETVLYAVT